MTSYISYVLKTGEKENEIKRELDYSPKCAEIFNDEKVALLFLTLKVI